LADSLEGQRTRLRDLEPGFAGLLEGVGGDQDLLASCRGADPSRNVHAPAAVVAAIPRRFGRVQTNPHRRREPMFAAVSREPLLDVDRALDRFGSRVECHEEAVAGALDLLAAVTGNRRPQLPVVPPEALCPAVLPHGTDHV